MKIYDIAGIGIGPFNLGLAALAHPIDGLECIFFDKNPAFSWHPGMMLGFAKLQVPFYADLVTGAEPASPFSFLSYMKQTGKLFQFAILEDNYITRRQYLDYCCWVAGRLDNLCFGHTVVSVGYNNLLGVYELKTTTSDGPAQTFFSKNIVLGVGSVPYIPDVTTEKAGPNFLHSSRYMQNRETLLKKESITIIGSGQSAAEIFFDLLQQTGSAVTRLDWATRADRLFPMDTSKFSLEMASPDYIDYFHNLSSSQRKHKLRRQDMLYKGINQELLKEIYELLYHNDKKEVAIRTNSELKYLVGNNFGYDIGFRQTEQQRDFALRSDAVILATGYHRPQPDFIHGIKHLIQWEDGDYAVNRNYSIDGARQEIFVQNADLHSHGFNAPDLGMGTYRNAIILNTILGRDHFMVEKKIAFQIFGV